MTERFLFTILDLGSEAEDHDNLNFITDTITWVYHKYDTSLVITEESCQLILFASIPVNYQKDFICEANWKLLSGSNEPDTIILPENVWI